MAQVEVYTLNWSLGVDREAIRMFMKGTRFFTVTISTVNPCWNNRAQINISPKKGPFQKENSLPTIIVQGRTVSFMEGNTKASLSQGSGVAEAPKIGSLYLEIVGLTLHETNSKSTCQEAIPKGKKSTLPFLSFFRCKLAVSFREGISV